MFGTNDPFQILLPNETIVVPGQNAADQLTLQFGELPCVDSRDSDRREQVA